MPTLDSGYRNQLTGCYSVTRTQQSVHINKSRNGVVSALHCALAELVTKQSNDYEWGRLKEVLAIHKSMTSRLAVRRS